MKISLLLLLLVCFLFTSPAFASQNDLVIDADNVTYDKEEHTITAFGSVEATYKDTKIYADELVYDTLEKKVYSDTWFSLLKDGLTFSGYGLAYAVSTEVGVASKVKVGYQGVVLSGQQVNFSRNQVRLTDAEFTSCDADHPHYHVSAREVVLYTDIEWVISNWGFFWLNRLPIVPIPTYLYDLRAEERLRRNTPPFPEIGSNDEDGSYIHQRLAWHVNKNWNGRFILSYYEKKRLGLGATGNYRLSDTREGNIRVFWNEVDQIYGGITHHIYFGEEFEEEADQSPNWLYVVPKGHPYDFAAEVSYRERINYEKVSYYPKLSVSSQRIPWPDKRLKWDFATSFGLVTEESTGVGVGFANLALGTYYDIPLYYGGVLIPSVQFDHRLYGDGRSWLRATHNTELKKTFGDFFGMGLGHKHYLYNLGASPFNFENYWFESRDEVFAQGIFKLGSSRFGVESAHYLPSLEPKDIDYIISIGFHCYDIILTYRAMRNEVNFGFSIGSR